MEHVAARQVGRDLIVDVFTTADGTALLLLCKTEESVRVRTNANVSKRQPAGSSSYSTTNQIKPNIPRSRFGHARIK